MIRHDGRTHAKKSATLLPQIESHGMTSRQFCIFVGRHGEKLKKLFAMLGQDNDGEFDNAQQKVSDILAAERRTWKAFVDFTFFRVFKRVVRLAR